MRLFHKTGHIRWNFHFRKTSLEFIYSERMIKNDFISIRPQGYVIYVIVSPIYNNIIKLINQGAHI